MEIITTAGKNFYIVDEVFNEEFPAKDRKAAEKRKKDWTKAKRKAAKARSWGVENPHLHVYVDGKVYECSCPLCMAKTSGKGVTKKQIGSLQRLGKHWRPSEVRKLDRDRAKLAEMLM